MIFIYIGRSRDKEFLVAIVANIYVQFLERIATVHKRKEKSSAARIYTSFEVGFNNIPLDKDSRIGSSRYLLVDGVLEMLKYNTKRNKTK